MALGAVAPDLVARTALRVRRFRCDCRVDERGEEEEGVALAAVPAEPLAATWCGRPGRACPARCARDDLERRDMRVV